MSDLERELRSLGIDFDEDAAIWARYREWAGKNPRGGNAQHQRASARKLAGRNQQEDYHGETRSDGVMPEM